ncbi:MAG: rhomboid family intramembrane serine protease [Candidatus Azobacteroides sp.]|nr:rhomboid family intramembrane serine protease [Candidatus Azobacteroides sp.]
MKYIFVLIFLIVFITFDKSIGYTDKSPVWTHFTYMFQHANIIHLTINSLAFIGMFRILEKIINKYELAIAILLIGFLASFMSMYQLPTVGISGAIYAMVGIYFGMITTKKLIIKDKNKLYVFIFSIILCLTVSFFKHNSNFWLHIFSLIMGYMCWMIFELWNMINE